MKFATEALRMQHDLAKQIPKNAWDSFHFFDRDLPDSLIPLMQAANEAALDVALKAMGPIADLIGKRCAFLAIAYSHPHFNVETLNRLSHDVFKFSNKEMFFLFIALGKTDCLEILETRCRPGELRDMIAERDYYAFRSAAQYGHLTTLKYLVTKVAPDKLQGMIAAGNYGTFQWAARNGHLTMLEYLVTKIAPKKLQDMIAANDYGAFQFAASNGHLAILEYLAKIAPKKLQDMIAADNYGAFQFAAQYGHLAILEYLAKIAPKKLQDMIAANNYYAFRWAASNGHLATLEYLVTKVAPDKIQDMIAANYYDAFRSAARSDHQHIINYLLTHWHQFVYAEQHMAEYGAQYVNPFVTQKLADLRLQKSTLEEANPNALFNITNPDEAKLLFFMLKNLIRRNDPLLLDDIRFLLDIPSVVALAHLGVSNARQTNELFRLAIQMGNQPVIEVLLAIPAIRALAAQNNYYREEARGGLDLAALARNAESSMTGLTTGEQKRLERATARYQPMIEVAGVPHLMDDLRQTLEKRYETHPATLVRDDASILPLPLSWVDFNTFKDAQHLTPHETKQALKAYYLNKDHTALRYLSKPNAWMSEHAGYRNENPANPAERWSTFDMYQPLISMLYLAAIDQEIKPCDGFTFETRLEHFIDELAHIGRAHNWDKSRPLLNADGSTRINEETGEPFTGEYDDLEADNPSCFSGTRRRLFQSVMGHPLLKMLTEEAIKEELRDFVRTHFKSAINDTNREGLREALDNYYVELDDESILVLKALDIPLEKQQAFITSLANKYESQFTEDPSFLGLIKESFRFKKDLDAHALNFAYLGLNELLSGVDNAQDKQDAAEKIQGKTDTQSDTAENLSSITTDGIAALNQVCDSYAKQLKYKNHKPEIEAFAKDATQILKKYDKKNNNETCEKDLTLELSKLAKTHFKHRNHWAVRLLADILLTLSVVGISVFILRNAHGKSHFMFRSKTNREIDVTKAIVNTRTGTGRTT